MTKINLNKTIKIIIIGICISLVSEIYINILSADFRISLSVVVFPILLLFYRELKIIRTSLIIGIIVFIFRSFIYILSNSDIIYAMQINYPVFFFYLSYGLIFYILGIKKKKASHIYMFLGLVICDFSGNLIELFIRVGEILNIDTLNIMKVLISVATIRSLAVVIMINIFKYYKLLIIKKEHEERYRRLILLISSLKGEIYFMRKNIDYIENVMKNSYELYEILDNEELPTKFKKLSLTIAKDVHEIKKDYERVIKGMEDLYSDKIQYKSMSIVDIFNILERTTINVIGKEKNNIDISFKSYKSFRTEKHYALISVLRNLINNSIEALEGAGYLGKIQVIHKEDNDKHIFRVIDNGKGIKESDKDIVFDPGFSTKFNTTTGDIYRGLGLTLVNDVVNDYFHGKVNFHTNKGKGTTFEIIISKEILEVQ